MKRLTAILCIGLLSSTTYAAEKTAEDLVASKTQADITYRQLMEIMGTASGLINEGLIRENKQMVRNGADLILNHPAPNHKPWSIMAKEDEADFKQTLLAFDKIMDMQADNTALAAEKNDWIGANNASHELMMTCVSCHASWKNRVK